ncbi:MAG TPA: hypothetical protein VIF15_20150 [Polyangiaceae bacterium]|jgi:hypothetical protein
MNARRALLSAVAAASMATAAFGMARAASARTPTLGLTVILATHTDGGTPSDAGPVIDRAQLPDVPTDTKPFKGYDVFQRLHHEQFALVQGKPIALADASTSGYRLDDGSVLQVTLDGVDTEGGEPRYALHVVLDEPGKKPIDLHVTVSAEPPPRPRGPRPPFSGFYLGGQSFQGGKLVVELVLR